MSQSGNSPVDRRWVLRTGALLGLGAGGILATGASGVGAAAGGAVPELDPPGAYGDPPSRAVVSRRSSLGVPGAGGVSEYPGSTAAAGADSGARPEAGVSDIVRQLHFRNNYGARIQFCIMFYSPVACAGLGEWGTRGWWTIDHGQSAYVLNTTSRRAYYFAEATDGGFWASHDPVIHAPMTVFDSCWWNQRIGDRQLGMRGIDLRADIWTVTLTRG